MFREALTSQDIDEVQIFGKITTGTVEVLGNGEKV